MVRALVDEWGTSEVSLALSKVSMSSTGLESSTKSGLPRSRSKNRTKPSAVTQVENGDYLGVQRELLMNIALRFDQKDFLPSIADVREFLILQGDRPGDLKDRRDSFRFVLKQMSQLPLDRLQQIATSSLHTGPARLGPLSDAISGAGEMHRRDADQRHVEMLDK
jgi:hypothetical protein